VQGFESSVSKVFQKEKLANSKTMIYIPHLKWLVSPRTNLFHPIQRIHLRSASRRLLSVFMENKLNECFCDAYTLLYHCYNGKHYVKITFMWIFQCFQCSFINTVLCYANKA
jgi:hypothetical protein